MPHLPVSRILAIIATICFVVAFLMRLGDGTDELLFTFEAWVALGLAFFAGAHAA